MGKNIIITESGLKSLLSEEVSRIMILNQVLKKISTIPEEYVLDKRNLRRGNVKYFWYAFGEEDLDGSCKTYDGVLDSVELTEFIQSIGFVFKESTVDDGNNYLKFVCNGISIEVGYGTDNYSKLTPPPALENRTDIKRIMWADLWISFDGDKLFKK